MQTDFVPFVISLSLFLSLNMSSSESDFACELRVKETEMQERREDEEECATGQSVLSEDEISTEVHKKLAMARNAKRPRAERKLNREAKL